MNIVPQQGYRRMILALQREAYWLEEFLIQLEQFFHFLHIVQGHLVQLQQISDFFRIQHFQAFLSNEKVEAKNIIQLVYRPQIPGQYLVPDRKQSFGVSPFICRSDRTQV